MPQNKQTPNTDTKTNKDNIENYDPTLKQYLYLSKQGREKYLEISRKAYQTMLIWSGIGITAGYTVYKFHPHVKMLRKYPRFGKVMFGLCSVMFTYHGYKLMGYMKRAGSRELSKNPEYQLTRQQYENQLKQSKTKQ